MAMHNAKCTVKGDILTIEVNLKERNGLSASGNTIIIGSTGGAHRVGDVSVNLSVYTKEGLIKEQLKKAKDEGFDSWVEYQKAVKGTAA